MPFNKPPLTFSDQVKLLQTRGLVIANTQNAELFLSQVNYYHFSGYCLPFEQNHKEQFYDNRKN